MRNFASNEFELYYGDNWRVTPNLTLTYGVRYMNLGVPYETERAAGGARCSRCRTSGAERLAVIAAGHAEQRTCRTTSVLRLHRAANGKDSWYGARPQQLRAARRLRLHARTAASSSMLTGKGGVIRAGGGLVYDRFGSDLVTKFDSTRVVRSLGHRARLLDQLHDRPALSRHAAGDWRGLGAHLPLHAARQ